MCQGYLPQRGPRRVFRQAARRECPPAPVASKGLEIADSIAEQTAKGCAHAIRELRASQAWGCAGRLSNAVNRVCHCARRAHSSVHRRRRPGPTRWHSTACEQVHASGPPAVGPGLSDQRTRACSMTRDRMWTRNRTAISRRSCPPCCSRRTRDASHSASACPFAASTTYAPKARKSFEWWSPCLSVQQHVR